MKYEQSEQLVPKLGSEVRFGDGGTAGKVKALQSQGFVVTSGKRRMRQSIIPYSSIASIGNHEVVLREKRPNSKKAGEAEKDGFSKKVFLKELDKRLGLDNLDRTERIVRITLNLVTARLPRERKSQIRRILPNGMRNLWTSSSEVDSRQSFEISDFLISIKKQGRLKSMEEAFIAAREVFASIKKMIPASEMTEIAHAIPRSLQEIWESAS